MKCLIQRVTCASVRVDHSVVGEIGSGLLVFIGVQPDDTDQTVARMAQRLLNYRLFSDAEGKMNVSVVDAGGSILLVPQFTLAADTDRGNRPSFSSAASPALAEYYYEALIKALDASGTPIATGQFGSDMQVSLINDGPVTFLLEG
jgi:D-tyrosyl-tRNA(Tyr) deacylase